MVKRIYIAKGRYALVDDDDAELVRKADWFPAYGPGTIYARTNSRIFGATQRAMHRLVMRALPGQVVDHINGDGLDNRRENLRFVTPKENAQNRFDEPRRDPHNDPGIKIRGTVGQTRVARDPMAPLVATPYDRRIMRLHRAQKRAHELRKREMHRLHQTA